MARISGIDLPRDKRIDVALTYVYGIGTVLAGRILKEANVKATTRSKDLSEGEVHSIQTIVNKGLGDGTQVKVEGDLRREIAQNIKRLVDIGSYRGSRHRKGLPVRGQRTKTNSRTRKGPRRTVAGKKTETK
ncbi:MAG: 30S ribosomal protein S13 [candidate division FCPU426 bacterium]